MRGARTALSLEALALVLAPAGAAAQGLTTREPRAADVETLDGIVAAFYDIVSVPPGSAADWARDSTLYVKGVRFTILERTDEGGWHAERVDHDTFARGFDAVASAGFFEREIHREVQRFGPMAHVFSTYEWRRTEDGPPGGRGINSIQLYHDGSRWWIVSAMWVGEDEGNPIPRAFLPDGS